MCFFDDLTASLQADKTDYDFQSICQSCGTVDYTNEYGNCLECVEMDDFHPE